MERQSNVFEKISGSLTDRFDFLEAVAGTMTGTAHRALDVTSGQEVTVWRTRGPLQASEVARFQERLRSLHRVPGVATILWCGVDARAVGFAVLGAYDGRKIHASVKSPKEIEERFDACAAVVEELHDRSITCGDLCLDSFLLNDRGKVTLFAVLGDVALGREDEQFQRHRYEAFRPPEQKSGGGQPTFVDVYALARIEEGLCAIPVKESGGEPVTTPAWATNLLNSKSSEELRAAHSSVRTLRLANQERAEEGGREARSSEVAEGSNPAQGRSTTQSDREKDQVTTENEELDEFEPVRKPRGEGGNIPARRGVSWDPLFLRRLLRSVCHLVLLFRNPSRVFVLTVLNIGALGVLVFAYSGERTAAIRDEAPSDAPVASDKKESGSLAAFYDSTDPATYRKLTDMLSVTIDPGTREQILRVLIFRSRRQNFGRTSDVVLSRFLDSNNAATFGGDNLSRPLVKALDPELSSNARLEEVARLYQVDPQLATVLAASSALDIGDAEAYRGIFAKAVVDQAGVPNGAEHNPYALMLLLPNVHDLFSEDILEFQEKIPPSDVVWLLEELGRQGRPEVSTVAQIAERRGVVTGAHVVFLQELRRSSTLNRQTRGSLVSGALGKLSIDDIRHFSGWDGAGSPRVLEASVLTTPNEALKSAAFDALTPKPLGDSYIDRVMEFVRTTYGDESARFAGVVATLALRNVVGTEIIRREFDSLQAAPRRSELLRQVVKGAPPEVIEIVLERYSESMDPLDIVDLLSHPSPQVRVAAVSSLTTVNDVMILKLISQSYDDESDPKVRAVYEEKISVVRDRL